MYKYQHILVVFYFYMMLNLFFGEQILHGNESYMIVISILLQQNYASMNVYHSC